jgi:hypothetical protein
VGEITMDNELLLQNVILFPDLRQLVDFRYRHKMLNWAVARDTGWLRARSEALSGRWCGFSY